MKELSLHILDIAKNSTKAEASLVTIEIDENEVKNLLTIIIEDNGCGMSEEFLKTVKNPFSTTRTTRKVGLGIPLLQLAAMQCGGGLDIKSKLGSGTVVTVTFILNHIDRAPIGDMAGTIVTLVSGSPDIDFVYRHKKNGGEFLMDTRNIREILDGVPLDTPDVMAWLYAYINEGLNEL